jgi:uncharacterized protein (DUF3820 family)
MKMPFGKYKDREILGLDSTYLIWIVKKNRGDFLSKEIGGDKFKISDDIAIEARKILKARGYEFKGNRIEKEERG